MVASHAKEKLSSSKKISFEKWLIKSFEWDKSVNIFRKFNKNVIQTWKSTHITIDAMFKTNKFIFLSFFLCSTATGCKLLSIFYKMNFVFHASCTKFCCQIKFIEMYFLCFLFVKWQIKKSAHRIMLWN